MPHLRPATACLRAAGSAASAAAARTAATTTTRSSAFSTTARRAGGGGHFDPPTGWLFGVKPGEKYEKEGWENMFFWGFYGSLGVFAVAYAFKPDTSWVFHFSLFHLLTRFLAGVFVGEPFG